MKYEFDCGCKLPVLGEEPKDCDGLPRMYIDYNNINYDCPATWALLGSGKTKGVFQLETHLGQSWSKDISPRNLNEMSALISLMRPGCLRAFVDDKSMTQHYTDRKHNREEVEYFHDALQPILEETYGVLTYQEQSMKIATDLAAFDLQGADILRKAIGKKKPEIMAEVERSFTEGCEKAGILNEEETKTIFGWIRESQKYAFNKSHGVGYGIVGYWTAYAKAHFPFHFFTSWLYFAPEKIDPQEEIQELVNDAKYFDVDILPPSFKNIHNKDAGHVFLDNNQVHFGMLDIKGVGQKHLDKAIANVKDVENHLGRQIDEWTWHEFLIYFADITTSTVVNGLISVGALSYMGMSRSQMLFDYNIWRQLTDKEKKIIGECSPRSLKEGLEMLLQNMDQFTKTGKPKPRYKIVSDLIHLVYNPPYKLIDTPDSIAGSEQELLGVPITCSRLDACDKHMANTTCREFSQGKTGDMSFVVEILASREYIIRRGDNEGKKMGFVTVGDETGSVKAVAFTEVWKKAKSILFKGNTVCIHGKHSSKSDDSLIIQKVSAI